MIELEKVRSKNAAKPLNEVLRLLFIGTKDKSPFLLATQGGVEQVDQVGLNFYDNAKDAFASAHTANGMKEILLCYVIVGNSKKG